MNEDNSQGEKKVAGVEENLHEQAPIIVAKLPEKDLKEKINSLRQRLEQNERELKTIFRDISFHNQSGQDLKAKRDGLHARIKELSPKAQDLRKKRDETNARIAELKTMRDRLRGKGREFSEKIGDLKKARDDLNLTARGRVETLEKAYADELNIFLTADIPLEHEISVLNRIMELGHRLEATKKANEVHTEISTEYSKAKEIYSDMDSLHAQIQTLAQESQNHHEEMIAFYNEIDTLRKEADSYHWELTEKYKGINPLRKKITALKAESPKLRAELEAYLEQMKEYQLERDAHKNEGKRELAKEKFKKDGRLSLDEFRLLVENEDIKL
ncbi:MAG: phosphoserine phosphatase [Candidatus Methanoperedens sp.]|nr:phosphoserine phosphatase [Candidatus Methanoperedens sp.]